MIGQADVYQRNKEFNERGKVGEQLCAYPGPGHERISCTHHETIIAAPPKSYVFT